MSESWEKPIELGPCDVCGHHVANPFYDHTRCVEKRSTTSMRAAGSKIAEQYEQAFLDILEENRRIAQRMKDAEDAV